MVKQIQSKGKIKLYNQETPLVVLHISPSIHLSNSRFSSPLVPGTTFLVRVLMKYFTLHHSPKHTHSIIFHHSTSYNVHLISGPHFYHEWVAAGLCAVLCTMDLDNDMLLTSTAYQTCCCYISGSFITDYRDGKTFLLPQTFCVLLDSQTWPQYTIHS